MAHWQGKELSLLFDMAGCPNRCRHCWLGSHPDGRIAAEEVRSITSAFRAWRGPDGSGIERLGVFTWWREPDYADNYRELWDLEVELSSAGCARRFELLSTWRLAHDETYAGWAASLGLDACQVTFFGMEDTTDWFMRRKGGFNDHLLATERLLEAGIAPRWQLFPTKASLGQLDAFLQMIKVHRLQERCEMIGKKFEFFLGTISPEGSGYQIEHLRLEEGDHDRIPAELLEMNRDGPDSFGQPESLWVERLSLCQDPPAMGANMPAIAINWAFDAYPNIAEPAPWWRLCNVRRDGVEAILHAYSAGTTPGMRANRLLTIGELARRYGMPQGRRLYTKADLICRWMHQWGQEHWQ